MGQRVVYLMVVLALAAAALPFLVRSRTAAIQPAALVATPAPEVGEAQPSPAPPAASEDTPGEKPGCCAEKEECEEREASGCPFSKESAPCPHP